MVNIELFNGNKNSPQLSLIDSGCDMSMLHADVATALGIDWSSLETTKVGGIGGSVDGYRSNIELKVQHFDEIINIPIIIVPNFLVNVLLGQYDFFNYYRVKFEKDHDTFELSRSPYKK